MDPMSASNAEYEDELASITNGMYGGFDSDDHAEEPSRPTSAPPTLDISNQNLFAFTSGSSAFQSGEDSFPALGEDHFPHISSHGTGSPPSASSASMSAFSAGITGHTSAQPPLVGGLPVRDPRKRTQSIEKFLAQSPGSILGPRKRYGLTATGAPRPGSTVGGAGRGGQEPPIEDPMHFIASESPGHSLRGLRKRLDALDLRSSGPDDSETLQRQLYLQHQQEHSQGYNFNLHARGGVPSVPEGDALNVSISPGVGASSPLGSAAGTPTAPRSPLHSPSPRLPGSGAGDGVDLRQGSMDAGVGQNHQQQQQLLHQQQQHHHLLLQHGSQQGIDDGSSDGHLAPSSFGTHESDFSMYVQPQSMYMQPLYMAQQHAHELPHQQSSMYMQVAHGDMQHAYFSPHGMPPPPPPFQPPGLAAGLANAQHHHQHFMPVGEPSVNGLQKVILPNGAEAMIVPMMQHGFAPYNGQQAIPQPPPGPPPRGGMVNPYGAQPAMHASHLAQMGTAQQFHPRARRGRGGGPGGAAPPPGAFPRGGGGRQQPRGHHHGTKVEGQVIAANASLEEFKGSIFQLSQEQNGCRFLQQKVDRDGPSACWTILEEVRTRLVKLMMDPFGNYLFQKLLEHATTEQRQVMLDETKDSLVSAALNLHGTRSVQKFIEVCGGTSLCDAQLDTVIEMLGPHVTKMSMDTNGNHVVQRCLQFIPRDRLGFVYDTVVRDVMIITRHRHGCCVFQRCIDATDVQDAPDPARREALVTQVVENAIELMQDPFGNYVVQYVLERSTDSATLDASRIIAQLPGRLMQLSMQKFSSNVVEKCLHYAKSDEIEPLIAELCVSETMRSFLNDQYANYVVQRALHVADDKQGMRLVQAIRPHLANLASSNASCARRVSGRVIKRFPSLSTDKLFAVYFPKDKFER